MGAGLAGIFSACLKSMTGVVALGAKIIESGFLGISITFGDPAETLGGSFLMIGMAGGGVGITAGPVAFVGSCLAGSSTLLSIIGFSPFINSGTVFFSSVRAWGEGVVATEIWLSFISIWWVDCRSSRRGKSIWWFTS